MAGSGALSCQTPSLTHPSSSALPRDVGLSCRIPLHLSSSSQLEIPTQPSKCHGDAGVEPGHASSIILLISILCLRSFLAKLVPASWEVPPFFPFFTFLGGFLAGWGCGDAAGRSLSHPRSTCAAQLCLRLFTHGNYLEILDGMAKAQPKFHLRTEFCGFGVYWRRGRRKHTLPCFSQDPQRA